MGEYTVTPLVNLDESAFELHLTPKSSNIKVEGNPISNLKFEQIKVNILGRVKYLEEGEDAVVVLEKGGKKVKSVDVVKGVFNFEFILPGSYKVKIVKPNYCWEKSSIDVEIKAEELNNLKFIQSGYALQYTSEKDVDVKISGESSPIHFYAGDHSHCLKAKGEYSITPIGCYKFPKANITYTTYSPTPVKLIPEEFLVEGYIETKDSSLTNLNDHVIIKCKLNSKETTLNLKKVEKGNYGFSFYSKKNTEAELVPVLVDDVNSAEQNILFNPKRHEVQVHSDCIKGEHAIKFTASKGLLIRGKVIPEISGIEVVVKDLRDGTIADRTTTTQTGEYKLGPLYDNEQNYQVSAYKEGYKIIKDPNNLHDFLVEQLSYLIITVKDTKGNPLSDVAFDLSHSARTYRNNSRTNKEGKTSFDELIPGEYYLKPLLKEYEFEPSQKTLQVVQGKKLDEEFRAKRIAFSAYGNVQLLDKRPLEDVIVDAVCVTCSEKSMESGKTNRDGNFRIRGLTPKDTYEVSVRLTSDSKSL
jgi:hypothetical protein